ncbi:DUF5362 family protein [Bacteroidales bacterium OttesenSCG-928-C19]|nr:DUF5362 family protein [Bacteroidales bacterium OttesenSCG-928-C19]
MEQEITQTELPELRITEEAKQYLKTTSSWTMFFAVLFFIGIGIMVFAAIILLACGGMISSYYPIPFTGFFALMGVVYLVLGGVLVFPALYLYRFSGKISKALTFNNTEVLTQALGNMKLYWKFLGILTIIYLGFCILFIPLSFILIAVSSFGF